MVASKKMTDISKSEAGLELQKLLLAEGALDIEAFNALFKAKGIKWVAAGISDVKTNTRKDEVEKYAKATELTPAEMKVVRSFAKAVEKAPRLDEPRALTTEEKDDLVEVEIIRRQVENIVKGLYEGDRQTAFTHMSFVKDDPYAEGSIVSLKHGQKIVVGKRELASTTDYSKLKEMVDEETWKSLVTETVSVSYEVDEEKVAEALADNRITMEQFIALVDARQISRNFTLKPLKDGDELL